MAPAEITDDYYAILEVSQTANAIDIKKSYHRLAILLHPDKNQNKTNATASFQLLNRAYETLKDESSRRIYDIRWPYITKTYRTAQENAKREAEAAKAENEKSTKKNAAREAEEQKSRVTMERLATRKQEFDSKIFEFKREIARIKSQLKDIQTLEDKALAEERSRNSWATYAYSSVFGATKEPEEAKQERDLQRLQRGASRTIKEVELSRKEAKLKEWNALLSGVEKAIAAEFASRQERERQSQREKEEARQREEAKARKKQQEEYMERQRAFRAAAEARAARERAAAEVLRRAAEERRKKDEEEKRQREAEQAEYWRNIMKQRQKEMEEERKREAREAEERQKEVAEMLRKMKIASEATSSRQSGTRTKSKGAAKKTTSSSAFCHHRDWWDKVQQGNLTCVNCHMRRGWLLECPNCQIRACAGCRKTLQTTGGKARKSQPPRAAGYSYSPPDGENMGYDDYDPCDGFDWYD